MGIAPGLDAAVHIEALQFDPAAASAPFVATLVDVTVLVIYFSVAFLVLQGSLLLGLLVRQAHYGLLMLPNPATRGVVLPG